MWHVAIPVTLTLTLFYIPVFSKDEIGKLYLSFEYYNPNGILVDGDKCDFLDTCDVYFFICVKNIGSTSCDIYEGKSERYENVNELKFAKMKEIVIPLKSPIGNSVEIGIDIWDFDGLDASDLIAHFDGSFQTKSLSMKWTEIPVTRTDLIYQNDVTFKGFARLECPGGSCNKVCVPRKGINTCDAEGNKICEKGLTGPACDQIDYCVENNCADYATCESFPNGYKCICGAYEGTRCQKGYDPCQIESPCGAHGQCKAAGPDYKCVCEVGWGGQKCDRPASACESAAQRLSPEAVCLNGGSCVDLQDNISYYCICLQPWSGTRCEVINTCTEERCSGHGVCIFSNTSQESFHCQCDAGWVGQTCNYRSQSPCHKASLKLHANGSMVCLHGGVCVDNPNGVDFSCKCPLGWFGPQCETLFIETLYFIVPVLVGAAAFLIILALCFRRIRKHESRQETIPMVYTSISSTERSSGDPTHSLIIPYAIYISSTIRNMKKNKEEEPRVFRKPTSPTISEQMGGPALPPRNSPLKTPSSDEQSECWSTKF